MSKESLVSVDIEASGPIPVKYSMLSIGACLVEDLEKCYYAELKPTSKEYIPAALEMCRLNLSDLEKNGLDPETAMRKFNDWIQTNSGDKTPRFVGFNGMFDWAFVNYYFIYYLGFNPFGHAGIDIKSYGMGITGKEWSEAQTEKHFDPELPYTHNALGDAIRQAKMFRKMLGQNQNK